MSEAEILEALTNFSDLGNSSFAIYISIVSGVLIAMFFIGEQLTRSQITLAVSLFVVFATSQVWASAGYLHWGEISLEKPHELNRDMWVNNILRPWQMTLLMEVGGIIGVLDFVRRLRKKAAAATPA